SVISTDGVLLPFWCTALYLLWRLRTSPEAGWATAIGLGLCMGAGFLSKYAMLYFFIGLGLTSLLDVETRRAVVSVKGLTAIGLAAALIAPHMIWNAANEFKTVGHTVDNANLGGDLINPENFGKFLADQMAVFGPISFLALLGGIWAYLLRAGRDNRERRDLWLLAFIVPVILIIAGQSVLSRAHANWAATAYPAASVLVAAWLVRAEANRWLWIAIAAVCALAFLATPDISMLLKLALGLGFGVTVLAVGLASGWKPVGLAWSSIGLHGASAALIALALALPAGLSTTLGLDNAFKRVRGWESGALELAEQARAMNATAILVDEREIWHGLDYYLRNQDTPPLIAWRRNAGPKSFSETTELTDALDDRVLVVSYRANLRPRIRADFAEFSFIGEVETPLGTRSNGCPLSRRFVLYDASGFEERTRDQAWEDEFEGLSERPNTPCPVREG
ncbi:MAG: glycosyltransferase family 39 protein, partial [Hyphomonadaceae bacterium]|nr:glycosyltransferase family 39 protein [Hyphomonadaceae bacterium]